MSKLQRIAIFIIALGIIGLLIFFAFGVFIIAIILAPIAYIYNKFYKKPLQQEHTEAANSDNSNVIDADYEVIDNEDNSTK